jgi:hypothetical protein
MVQGGRCGYSEGCFHDSGALVGAEGLEPPSFAL